LLENLRFHIEEEKNDRAFAQALAKLADVYINDAFGAAHRAHASISGMAEFFKIKGAGLLLQKELDYLSPILANPEKPFVTILGGAKVSDKIGVIRNLLPKVSVLLIGGGMAYTFLKARGIEIGKSLVEQDKLELAKDLMKEAATHNVRLILPIDHITGDSEKKNPASSDGAIPPEQMGLDIGAKTAAQFAAEIRKAKLVLWNGPVGLFEVAPFDQGSRLLANTLAENYPRSSVSSPAAIRSLRSRPRVWRIKLPTSPPAAVRHSSFSRAESSPASRRLRRIYDRPIGRRQLENERQTSRECCSR
jgi:phosphoglycerate kinase